MSEPVLPRPLRTAGIVTAWVLAALLVGALVGAAWIGIRGLGAYSHLRNAQAQAGAVAGALHDPAQAPEVVAKISAETGAARELTSDPVWNLASRLPWVGPQLAAVATVAAAADDVASNALTPLSEVAAGFTLDSLRPVDGRIDVAAISDLQSAAASGASGVARAAASVDAIDQGSLLAPLRTAVADVETLLDSTAATTDALARATTLMPAMLGADGPRDYLVLVQNNAEWRSLGGIPGALALVHTDGGSLSLAAQESSSDFPRWKQTVLPLTDEVRAIYRQRPGQWIQNVTQVPDFATSAALAREMWALRHDGQQVDGVIALDPVALSYLLAATGPVTLPSGDVLTSDNAVQLLLNDVYLRYANPRDQDDFFAAAAAAVFDSLASGSADPVTLVEGLTRAGDERRLLLWSAHEDDQAVLADTTLIGALPQTDAETARFGVFLNDGTGSKMDYYLTAATDVAWDECVQDAAGQASGSATATITLTSNAPADAASLPAYITGNGVYGVPEGTARTVVYVYLPEGFELAGAELSTGDGFGGGVHEGRRVVSFTVDLAPGESATATITAQTTEPGASTVEVQATPTLTPSADVAAVCRAS